MTDAAAGQRAEMRAGVLKAFDNVNWLATVQLTGSLQQWVTKVPVARNIAAAEMTAGRKVAVLLFDPANHTDAVVVGVWV